MKSFREFHSQSRRGSALRRVWILERQAAYGGEASCLSLAEVVAGKRGKAQRIALFIDGGELALRHFCICHCHLLLKIQLFVPVFAFYRLGQRDWLNRCTWFHPKTEVCGRRRMHQLLLRFGSRNAALHKSVLIALRLRLAPSYSVSLVAQALGKIHFDFEEELLTHSVLMMAFRHEFVKVFFDVVSLAVPGWLHQSDRLCRLMGGFDLLCVTSMQELLAGGLANRTDRASAKRCLGKLIFRFHCRNESVILDWRHINTS